MATIQNTTPRLDADGNVIDCHDGCLRFFGGRYFLYGTAYGHTDGFTAANRYAIYSSPDLETWSAHGDMLAEKLPGVGYRPYVVQDPGSGKYVCWFNWYPVLWEGRFGVATADRPEGPFEVVEPEAAVAQPEPGDHNLFVDEDGTGYLVYTSIPATRADGSDHHGMSVERLKPGLTGSTGQNSGVFASAVEAPSLFRHAGAVWCVFGETCCFCPEGAGARLYRADHPMDPWSFVTDLNRRDDGSIIVPGQQTDVAVVPTADGEQLWWMADLWESRPGGTDGGTKGHDLQHWEPLRFDNDGVPQRLRGVETFEVEPVRG